MRPEAETCLASEACRDAPYLRIEIACYTLIPLLRAMHYYIKLLDAHLFLYSARYYKMNLNGVEFNDCSLLATVYPSAGYPSERNVNLNNNDKW